MAAQKQQQKHTAAEADDAKEYDDDDDDDDVHVCRHCGLVVLLSGASRPIYIYTENSETTTEQAIWMADESHSATFQLRTRGRPATHEVCRTPVVRETNRTRRRNGK